ncbi:lysophospholipid acyltransferase family protein [Polymorphum gilvum]|uniref:1-acyl-sn-glycerol-3-phosphate acyltransferase protein n=1 Tax=Polymorphum gilvum (strain LMG 25793 / CGMCC 1.9160 / SL003B-26A1) TaxID=991905 RepID=F2IZE9_POLGS|nr:lysophospholipid acyltransferase family protein [Polymorphum gilvum]ADZ68572.1 1-acyl-sn-glycerol-3-phosphate acyltransferase protein [Polymorphum gilvum SL003B-26A1]
MLFLRSLLFNVLFYGVTLVMMIVGAPVVFLLPRRWGWPYVPLWANVNLFLLRWIVGLKVEVRGRENIPEGGFIVAAKHQSAWETFALIPHFRDPTYILKRELRWIPLFGWYTAKMKQIPINRGKKSAALAAMMVAAKEAIDEGRQILIFPEGTRRPAGAPPSYKYGVAHLYRDLDCPVLPVALNAGVYWPRRSFVCHPGTVILEFLPPIDPGLPMDAFFDRLVDTIETASDRLIEEARQAPPLSPVLAEIDAERARAVRSGQSGRSARA